MFSFEQTVYNKKHFKVMSLVSLMRKHALVSARKEISTWTLEMRHDRLVVKFSLEGDWQHFQRTFLVENERELERRGLVPPTPDEVKFYRRRQEWHRTASR